MKLYNSLSRKIEEFKPIHPPAVHMYTCGPTVYDFAHIGNFRTYTSADFLVRILKYNGYNVEYVMNLTDVGHLTGDNLGDADLGEDRMEKAAKKEGKTAWDIAKFYADAFIKDFDLLNLERPKLFVKATDHIKEQIDLVGRLEKRGYAYQISDGVYFDTSRFKDYGKLSDMDQIREGVRVEVNPEKRNPRDFALWKFSYPEGRSFDSALRQAQGVAQDDIASRRQMEWESPWGVGFPGWHIECSAMGMKYLGESFDIHAGGIDLKQTHHPNEIAQAEAATGKQFVKYWVHSAFVLVAGERMSKSLGNNYKLYDLMKQAMPAGRQGYNPLALRYLYLQTHYRQEMNFTFPALDAASIALKKLLTEIATWDKPEVGCAEFEGEFLEAINDDLNMPKALAVVWELVKSDNPTRCKAASLFKMDQVLGLNLQKGSRAIASEKQVAPEVVKELLRERELLRKASKYRLADQVRKKINDLGYEIEDTKKGTRVRKKS
ncbi:cysteine--tRNA ligase [Patescibacteria group bacterium]|nr:cysteine--tRNA ligase [Patescibacteria group bacterium]